MNVGSMFSAFAILICSGLLSPPKASAQLHLDHPAVEACAEQVYAAVRPLARGPYRRWEILPTIYAGLRRADACGFSDEAREAMRLDALALAARPRPDSPAKSRLEHAAQEALLRASRGPRDPTCEPSQWMEHYFACEPVAIPVRELNVGTRPRFLNGPTRFFVVQLVDALSEADPRLVASAQLLWMYASWMNCECVPSITFLWMRRDLREGRVRLAAYPDERLETHDASTGVALFPGDAARGYFYRPFRHDPHPRQLSPGM